MDSVGELVFDRTRIERRVGSLQALTQTLQQTQRRLRDAIAEIPSSGATQARLVEINAALAEQTKLLDQATRALMSDADALSRTGTALQDGLTQVRMQTVRTLFLMLAPLLRSIAREVGKRVKLVTIGGETEFDKAVAEQVTDSLVQLLRNAVAHGIEPVSARRALGKPDEGQITIAARHEGNQVVLEVSDDGAGIDATALRRRFVASGRWSPAHADTVSDADVLRVIFDPGVSSREQVDSLAGRGVGLDAVRQTVARLGGEIRVRSTPDKGTTFTLRLPLTTAISNALLFKVNGNVYAVPNVHVVDTMSVETSSPVLPSDLSVGGAPVPLVALHAVLEAQLPVDARRIPAVVIEYLGRRLAMTCDKIVGPREIVLKNLGPLLSPLPLYAGGTISGSGKVQLILDPAALVRLAYPDALSEPEFSRSAPPGQAAASLAATPQRVLVAEDSRVIREAMSRILQRAGYVVDVAEDGQVAWQLMERAHYDVLVTDLEMPHLDGFALMEKLRGEPTAKHTRVIVVSSRTSAKNRKRASSLGARSFIDKPVTPENLLQAVAAHSADR